MGSVPSYLSGDPISTGFDDDHGQGSVHCSGPSMSRERGSHSHPAVISSAAVPMLAVDDGNRSAIGSLLLLETDQ